MPIEQTYKRLVQKMNDKYREYEDSVIDCSTAIHNQILTEQEKQEFIDKQQRLQEELESLTAEVTKNRPTLVYLYHKLSRLLYNNGTNHNKVFDMKCNGIDFEYSVKTMLGHNEFTVRMTRVFPHPKNGLFEAERHAEDEVFQSLVRTLKKKCSDNLIPFSTKKKLKEGVRFVNLRRDGFFLLCKWK